MLNQKLLENSIYSYIKEKGAVYESDVLTKFSESEDIRTMGEIYKSIDKLYTKGKIELVQKSGQVLVDAHRGTTQ